MSGSRSRWPRCTSVLLGCLALTFAVACSNPIERGDDGATATAGGTGEVESTGAPLMRIVTPTPVDPNAIPPTATTPSGPVEVPDVYVVQENDTLYAIATRFNVDLARLVEVNNLSDPNDIQVGQELTIPKD